jgi:hypothetical protein
MSDIPGLALILAGSYFFLTWIQTDRVSAYFVAFCFAEAAFLSRHLAGGVLRHGSYGLFSPERPGLCCVRRC